MHDARAIPQDLESCQRQLQEAWALHAELGETCTTLQYEGETLRQEKEELQATIQHLLHQLYGRRSERFVEGAGQQHLDFGDDDSPASDPSVVSAAPQDPVTEEFLVRRRKGARKPRTEQFPAHLERRTLRIEPELPAGIRLEDCQLIGIDVVEQAEYQRGKLWVRRIEYPKYKLPSWAVSVVVEAPTLIETPLDATAESVLVNADADAAAERIPSAVPASETDRAANTDVSGKTQPVLETALDVATGPVVVMTGTPVAAESGKAAELAAGAACVAGAAPHAGATDDGRAGGAALVVPTATIDQVVAATVSAHGIMQAPRLISLVEGGHFGFSIAAEVLSQKFGLHVPLYRQQDSLAQLGWSPHRSTLGLIVQNAAELFSPLAGLFRQRVLAADILGTDDTPVTLLTPGEANGSRQARFWLYRGRHDAPYDVFAFTDSRTRDGPDNFLEPFRGTLCGDCYSGYVNIEQVTHGRIQFAACLGHARRYVFQARAQQPILGSQMMAQFRQLYDIEDRARTMDDAQRWALRQQESVPVMKRLRELLEGDLAKRVLPKSKFGEALGYLRNHWDAFQVYLQDGCVPIDNNDVERDLRRIAVGRNNWLFVGSLEAGERAATIITIMASAHRHDLDVWQYVCDALEKLAHGRAAAGGDVNHIDPWVLESLLPDVWAKAHPEAVRHFRAEEKERRAATRRFQRAERRRTRSPR
jgi:transposase